MATATATKTTTTRATKATKAKANPVLTADDATKIETVGHPTETPAVSADEKALSLLIREFNKAYAPVTRAETMIEKQKGIIRYNRAVAVRVYRKIMANPAMHKLNGTINFTRISSELVLSKGANQQYKLAVELVDAAVANKTLEWDDEKPSEAEVILAAMPWDDAKKLKAEARAAAKAEAETKATKADGSEPDNRDSTGDADIANMGITYETIVDKVRALNNTVDLAIKAGIKLTETEDETINGLMAELMTKLGSMVDA